MSKDKVEGRTAYTVWNQKNKPIRCCLKSKPCAEHSRPSVPKQGQAWKELQDAAQRVDDWYRMSLVDYCLRYGMKATDTADEGQVALDKLFDVLAASRSEAATPQCLCEPSFHDDNCDGMHPWDTEGLDGALRRLSHQLGNPAVIAHKHESIASKLVDFATKTLRESSGAPAAGSTEREADVTTLHAVNADEFLGREGRIIRQGGKQYRLIAVDAGSLTLKVREGSTEREKFVQEAVDYLKEMAKLYIRDGEHTAGNTLSKVAIGIRTALAGTDTDVAKGENA